MYFSLYRCNLYMNGYIDKLIHMQNQNTLIPTFTKIETVQLITILDSVCSKTVSCLAVIVYFIYFFTSFFLSFFLFSLSRSRSLSLSLFLDPPSTKRPWQTD